MSPAPRSPLADTHCHLNLSEFDPDRLQVIERALEAGIDRILIPGIDVETSRSAIQYAQQFPGVFAAIGVHPNRAATWSEDTLSLLRKLAREAKVVAIGEIGLDYYRDFTPRDVQRSVFIRQVGLASELDLPVIVHNRQASQDICNILLEWVEDLTMRGSSLAKHPGVLHSFSGSVEMATTMATRQFKLGITGPVTYRNAQEMQAVVAAIPLESLLIETDAPYLTPVPYRGKRNEPANVRIVAEKIAELKTLSIEMVANITSGSAERLFNWREDHC